MTVVADIRSPVVCAVTGVTYRQLEYWDTTGLACSTVEAHGSGTQRLYTIDDVVRVAIVKRLLDAGVSVQRVRSLSEPLADPRLLNNHQVLAFTTTGAEIVDAELLADLVEEHGLVYAVNIGPIREHVETRLAEHRARPLETAS